MSEAELIEIAQRRRKLEDSLEATLSFVRECEERNWWPRHRRGSDDSFTDTIEDAERAAELCRDDMNRMADVIRARNGK